MPCGSYEGRAGGYEIHQDELHARAEVEDQQTDDEEDKAEDEHGDQGDCASDSPYAGCSGIADAGGGEVVVMDVAAATERREEYLSAELRQEGYETELDPEADGERAEDGLGSFDGWADGLGGGERSHRLCDEGTVLVAI